MIPLTVNHPPVRGLAGRWREVYSAVVLAGFVALYLPTRLPLLVSDSGTFIEDARLGDVTHAAYGYPGHFLQIPLAGGIWRGLGTLGLPVSLESVWLGLCLAGTLAAIIFLGLIAAELLHTKAAAWLAALLFGTSLNMWWQWNGELYGLALGFLTAGLFLALRRHLFAAALLWALSVACHIEFALAAPAFVGAVWIGRESAETTGDILRRASSLLLIAGTSTLIVLIVPMWALGKWRNISDLEYWLTVYFQLGSTSGHVRPVPEVLRASKGLLTAYTVAGHYWRDILTGRGVQDLVFVFASAVGLLVLAATGVFLAAAAWRRRLVLLALLWLVPFQMFFNWWFVPNDAKYHAGALPGFVLLVTGGLVHVTSRMTNRGRYAVYVAYVATCAGLTLFGSVLPMQARGANTIKAAHEIRRLNEERGGRAVLVSCTDSHAVVRSGIEHVRIKRIWQPTVPETQETVLAWLRARLKEGKEPYVLDRWCRPEEWFVPPPPPFDLFFLEREFDLVPTAISRVPVAEVWETNPFSWRRGDVVRLIPRQ